MLYHTLVRTFTFRYSNNHMYACLHTSTSNLIHPFCAGDQVIRAAWRQAYLESQVQPHQHPLPEGHLPQQQPRSGPLLLLQCKDTAGHSTVFKSLMCK